MKNQILYIFDPLCGWCYGFSATMLKFYERYRDHYEFVAIPGGMVTGARVKPISEMEDFISEAYERVEQRTGTPYGDAYLNGLLRSKTTLLDSEPPSRALHAFRSFHFERGIEFAHALQKAHYLEGKDFNDESVYRDLAKQFDLEPETFMKRFREERIQSAMEQEFAWVSESGIQGFPTVVCRYREKYYLLAHGYCPLAKLEESLERAKSMMIS